MLYIGIDNGVTGWITMMKDNSEVLVHMPMPVKKELSYTKAKQYITRIDGRKLCDLLMNYRHSANICVLERPFVNPGMFKSTLSAIRSLEATLIVLESLMIPYSYIDSREWQSYFLPSGLEKKELKKAAIDIAKREYPSIITKDADSLLMTAYLRLKAEGLLHARKTDTKKHSKS